MVTAPISVPAQVSAAAGSARAGGAPGRKQAAPVRQRISTAVLVVGTVLSLGSLAGPDWALRAGVVVALASAIASCALAWRELYLTKRKHARDLLVVSRRHTENLRAERRHNADVLDTVSDRAQRWRQEVDRQQTQIAGLRVETTALRSDLTSVRRQLVRADSTITGLREAVRDRDVELALLRPVSVQDTQDPELSARVVALATTDADNSGVVPALPNFEADRRLA